MYKIRCEFFNAPQNEPRVIDVALTTRHQTDGEPNLSVQLGKTVHGFATKTVETRAANKLRRLVENLDLRIPSTWADHSGTCNGSSTDLTIECGHNKLQLHWFCDCPLEWTAVADLAAAIREIAYKCPVRSGSEIAMESNSKSADCDKGESLDTANWEMDIEQLLNAEKILRDKFYHAQRIQFKKLKRDVEKDVGLYGIFFRDRTGKVEGLKVGISKNLKRRLDSHFESRDSALKRKDGLKMTPEYSDGPDGLVSKGSILAKHLFFDDELGREFNVNLKTKTGRKEFLNSHCFVLVQRTQSKKAAKVMENELEASNLFRYVREVIIRP